jgi:hypothetical protein
MVMDKMNSCAGSGHACGAAWARRWQRLRRAYHRRRLTELCRRLEWVDQARNTPTVLTVATDQASRHVKGRGE